MCEYSRFKFKGNLQYFQIFGKHKYYVSILLNIAQRTKSKNP